MVWLEMTKPTSILILDLGCSLSINLTVNQGILIILELNLRVLRRAVQDFMPYRFWKVPLNNLKNNSESRLNKGKGILLPDIVDAENRTGKQVASGPASKGPLGIKIGGRNTNTNSPSKAKVGPIDGRGIAKKRLIWSKLSRQVAV